MVWVLEIFAKKKKKKTDVRILSYYYFSHNGLKQVPPEVTYTGDWDVKEYCYTYFKKPEAMSLEDTAEQPPGCCSHMNLPRDQTAHNMYDCDHIDIIFYRIVKDVE